MILLTRSACRSFRQPDAGFVKRAPGLFTRTLSASGRAYAIYAQGRSMTILTVNLEPGSWTAEWLSIEDGRVLKRETIAGKGLPVRLGSPEFSDAVALRLVRQ